MVGCGASVKTRRLLTNGALVTLMLGHFTNDMFGGVLPMLYPSAKERFDLGNGQIGLITLAYTGTSSLSQPFFGYLSDRHGRRWFAPAMLIWGAVWVSLYGFAGSYAAFLGLAALAGLASGAYHPFGASNAAAVSDERGRNSALSIYTVGGTSGYALGPIVGVILLGLFGVKGTGFLIVPGLVFAALIYSQMGRVERARKRLVAAAQAPAPIDWPVLSRVVGLVMLRAWVMLAVIQFIPIWYDELGYGRATYGALSTCIILAGVIGTLGGGMVADRLGARTVMVVSLVLAVPPLLIFAGFPGPIAFAAGILFGIFGDGSLSVTLVAAQRLMPGRTGVASGMILGIGFITGGIGVPLTGRLADATSIPTAIAVLSILLLAAAALGWTIPRSAFQPRSMDIDSRESPPEQSTIEAPRVPVAAGRG
jgi:MFS transporter, FSR family, fosmidomycin resistance protein